MCKCIYTGIYIYIYTMLAWNQRPRNSRRDNARAPRRLRVRCSAYSSPPLRVHTPVCSAPGKRMRARIACVRGQGRACGPSATLSLLDPPASPSPLLCSPLVPCAISPFPITAAAIALSVFLCRALSLPLPFAFLCSKRHAVSDGLETRSELIDRECWIFGLRRRES